MRVNLILLGMGLGAIAGVLIWLGWFVSGPVRLKRFFRQWGWQATAVLIFLWLLSGAIFASWAYMAWGMD